MDEPELMRLNGDLLRSAMVRIQRADQAGNYEIRNQLIAVSVATAMYLGYQAGFGYDDKADPQLEGRRIVAYIELPTGQVSWHLPEHPIPFDGHDTPTKYARAQAYAADRGQP
jgi:hypothetical protein